MSNIERIDIALRNVREVLTKEELISLITENKNFSFYLGIAPTGPVHIGYFVPLMKIIDLIRIGGAGKILIADYHAFLDDRKTPWEEINIRAKYYETSLKLVLGNYADKVKFIRGSEFQTSKEYVEDMFKLASAVTVNRAKRAASMVVRMKSDPHVSELIYPIMQIVDVKHLKADVAVGGIDQRHIYALGREIIHLIGWKKYISIFTPLIASLKGPGSKMSASEPSTIISVHDSPNRIREKIKRAYCPIGEITDNPIIDIVRYILIPYFEKIVIEREQRYGGDIVYTSYKELENDYINKKLHPADLKNAVAEYLIKLLKPVRKYFENNTDFLEEVKKSLAKSGYVIED